MFTDMFTPFKIFVNKKRNSQDDCYTQQQETKFFITLLQSSNRHCNCCTAYKKNNCVYCPDNYTEILGSKVESHRITIRVFRVDNEQSAKQKHLCKKEKQQCGL